MARLTQKQRILNLLNKGKRITQAQARTYNILSLSSRINELRRAGHEISVTPVKRRDGRIVAQYHM